jgi:hypothetical protein
MRRARGGALVAMAMMIAMAGPLPAGNAPQTGASKTGQANAGKAPAKARAAKKTELAKRRDEFTTMLITQEKNTWVEGKKQNADFFREAMTEQFVAVESDGKRYSKEEVLRLIPTAGMTSYEVTDFQMIRAGRDAAVITYRATFIGPVEGKERTTRVLATTVWVRRGEKWKMAFHQKTLAPGKP